MKRTVIVIDDNSEITKMLSRYLSLENFEVVVSNSGRNGLDLVRSRKHDKVLLDLAMPEFSGIDVLEELNKTNYENKQKIILFTASSLTSNEIDRLMKMGVHSCIKKPIKMNQLIPLLNS